MQNRSGRARPARPDAETPSSDKAVIPRIPGRAERDQPTSPADKVLPRGDYLRAVRHRASGSRNRTTLYVRAAEVSARSICVDRVAPRRRVHVQAFCLEGNSPPLEVSV